MKIKLTSCFLVSTLISFLFVNFSYAQGDIPEDVVVGGKAICAIRGRVPVKKVKADGNRLLLLQSGGITNGSFSIQLIIAKKKFSIDLNILGLFGRVEDVDSFLNGEVVKFENSNSDFVLKKTRSSNGVVREVSNLLSTGEKGNLKGKIKVTSSENNLVNGRLKFTFQNTSFKFTMGGEDLNGRDNNGKVVVVCRFKDVPVAIKEVEL